MPTISSMQGDELNGIVRKRSWVWDWQTGHLFGGHITPTVIGTESCAILGRLAQGQTRTPQGHEPQINLPCPRPPTASPLASKDAIR